MHIDSFPVGAPCWYELATTDQAGAKAFYSALLGWTAQDFPMGDSGVYTTFGLEGRPCGAAYTLTPDQADQGVPPHWMVYFCSDDADASAAKAAGLGATVIVPPFDVFDFGRMYVAQDPGGAHYSVWQPNTHSGARIVHQLNAMCWVELATRDSDKCRDFYSALFGWSTKPHSMPGYTIWGAGGKDWGGIITMDDHWKGIPSHWSVYWSVADCDAAVAKAQQLGARLNVPAFDAPGVGRICNIADPQGAASYLIHLTGM
jgi:predicted enzyme related to lactoylglutathione lyase